MKNAMARRWGDNDTYFGPLTFARAHKGYRPTAIMLGSGDDEYPGAGLRVSVLGATVILALPGWVVPAEKTRVYPTSWDAATIQRLGRDWYWDVKRREFGFTLSEGHLSLHYGRQTMDSSTEKSKGWFLPWRSWRHVRHSLYGLDGAHFADMPHKWGLGDGSWEERERVEASCPTATFAFKDFDGETLAVRTKIEEREWHLGEGRFKWLSWFAKPRVSRSLDLRFSGETGRRKGSWKGGTIGHSVGMLPGELHEAAFRRYCAENNMAFMEEPTNG